MALDRNQVPAERKWRVEDIFENVEAWNATYAECEGELDFSEFEGKLNTVERSGCFFDLGPALWVCILGVGAAAFFLIRRRARKKAKRVWRCT